MALIGYSLPDTLTDDAGNALKGVTVTVTGPASYSGVATSDATTGLLRLGPLPVGDYVITLGDRSVTLPVIATGADIVAEAVALSPAPDLSGLATTAALTAGLAAQAASDSGTYVPRDLSDLAARNPVTGVFYAEQYDAPMDNNTANAAANTAAIQAAINDASLAGGGVVQLPGRGNATKIAVTTIGMRAGVTLRGYGPGGTVLRGTNPAAAIIYVDETAGSVDRFTVEELQTESGACGFYFAHTNNANQLSFARGVIRNCIATSGADGNLAGFYLGGGCLEYRLENCHAKSNTGDGFRFQSTDHFVINCTAQANGIYGFRVNGANNHFANCKAFGNQRGWVIDTNRHVLTGCEAQENGSHGFSLGGADVILSGCLADSNGDYGFNVETVDHHTLTGCHSVTTAGLAYAHDAGFRVAGGGNRNTHLVGCTSRDSVALDPASVTTGCTVDINGSGFASAGGVGGLLATKTYGPAVNENKSTSSATLTDVDATNLAVTFTVPASGKVLVRLSGFVTGGATTTYSWGLREGSTTVAEQQVCYNQQQAVLRLSSQLLVTGLTPGASLTYKWAHRLAFGANACHISVNDTSHGVMEVIAA